LKSLQIKTLLVMRNGGEFGNEMSQVHICLSKARWRGSKTDVRDQKSEIKGQA